MLGFLRRRFAPAIVGALAIILLLVWAIGHAGGDASPDGRSIVPSTAASVPAGDQMGTIRYGALPPQAQDTLALVAKGGPYPYEHDGIVFQNREGLLPDREQGFYREFTVQTPGSSDRGARRIVRARDGTLYYTDDHYRSFERIVR